MNLQIERCEGIMLPGLAMAADEFPEVNGLLRLNNPGAGGEKDFSLAYSIEDVAMFHAKKIQKFEKTEVFHAAGMSMGGMILAVLATKYRDVFPNRTFFHFFVTSPNLPTCPAVPEELKKKWFSIVPETPEDFEFLVSDNFSSRFLRDNPEKAWAYYEYRARKGNQQKPSAFIRQFEAARQFRGEDYFARLNPHECRFVGGAEDAIFGPKHNAALKKLVPGASHLEVADLGHMINIERPEFFTNLKDVPTFDGAF